MLKIIMQAGNIPVGSTVTKINGQRQYTLVDSIKLYGLSNEGAKPKIIACDEGCRFLCGGDETFNAVGSSTEVVWLAEEEAVLAMLEGTPQ